ncbi:hypothetical protein B0T24DRAFT_599736 [Lasiosphaeria ovina]|uniref:Uncharacterized protein n=1 Tax=Lasiosphaeria ovina TaxID=92902 RepID=A0AAE0JSI4_9PEZI|nr:hypothetical protein B0T24DRAFT_599736 [Lasiosphaeria ovina]
MDLMRYRVFEVMSYISDHMILRAERSFDLLMGIIVVLGWSHYSCFRHSLDRSASGSDTLVGAQVPSEERRLLLGVWYLRSSYVEHVRMTGPPFIFNNSAHYHSQPACGSVCLISRSPTTMC